MSDPDAQRNEPTPPPQPPRRPTGPTSAAQSQMAADEQYARQLAEHYNGAAAYGVPRGGSRGRQRPHMTGPQRTGSRGYEVYDEDRERSFIDGMMTMSIHCPQKVLPMGQMIYLSFGTTSKRDFWKLSQKSIAGSPI